MAHDHVAWFFGHFWSLALEEQFYLLWPIMLIKLSTNTLKKTVIVILLLTPVIRVVTYFLMPGSRGQEDMMMQTGGHSIFIGCLGALIEDTNFFKEKVLKMLHNTGLIWATAIFLFIISPLLFMRFVGVYELPLGGSLNNLGIIILLFWCLYVPSKVSDFLNTKVMIQIGVLSYSLYIWQQLFLQNILHHFWFNKFPVNIILVFIVAFTSYYVIEKPFISLKKRFARI
jgi:peptidoglycan/LPS O-acetylase OafA/YrhL